METIIENPQTIQLTEECIKGTYRFSETLYHNICTGVQYVVPYGFWDYFLAFLLVAFIFMILGLLIKLLVD